jgi:hypothetical protein
MAFSIQWRDRGVYWTFSGTLTGEEAVRSNLEIYGDERFDDLRYQIADFSGVEHFALEPREMKKVAYFDKAASLSNPKMIVALIAPTPVSRDLLNKYTEYSESSPWVFAVFDTLQEAQAWVDSKLM